MKDLLNKRLVLVSGKGGVGKSSLTASLAHVAHQAGKRVLVVEIGDGSEDYSPVAQLLGRPRLPMSAEDLGAGIWGSQLLPSVGLELFLTSVLKVAGLAKTAMGFEPLRRLFMVAPSFREMAIFYHLVSYLRAARADGSPLYDLVLVDMPATGHTLALTGLPDVVLRVVTRGPIADAIREGQAYLNDPARVAACVVTLPEAFPLSEALELLEGLRATSMPCGGVFINRMPNDAFSADERRAIEEFVGSQSFVGLDAFRLSRSARDAVAMAMGTAQVPSLTLPEFDQSGTELVTCLVSALEPQFA